MDGGSLSVPFDRLNEFYKIYIQSIKNNENISVVEKKTSIYNFFMDIDYVSTESLKLKDIEQILQVVCKCIKRDCVISISKPKHKNGKMKTGIHLNWFGLRVKQGVALEYRENVIKELVKYNPNEDWNAIIDECVYKGSGLRMLWSRKYIKKSNIWESEYVPILEYVDGEFERITDSSIKISFLERTSIRVKPQINTPPPPPPPPCTSPPRGGGGGEWDALEKHIRKHMAGHEYVRITNVEILDGHRALVTTSSKWCEGIKNEHKSNHIYFIIDGRSIHQRCHDEECKKRTKKNSGIVGREYTVPQSIYSNIFSINK